MTGQGILLVGMMTEAVVTPWLSDRDLALQNVRYVHERGRQPARGLPCRAPDGFIAAAGPPGARRERSTCWSGSSPRVRTGLLDAIADGTFGLMKRPADAGRGLDGVAAKAAGYFNPATELLEAT